MSFDVFYSAWNIADADHETGDAANHTVSVNVDGADVTGLTEAEVGNGRYKVTLSDAQLPPGSRFAVHGSSSTSSVKLFGESGVRPADKTVHTETILYVKIGATTLHKIDLGVFGSTVSGTPSAQLYIDNTATGSAYNLTGASGTEWPLPITLADDATLKGKSVRVTVTATVDGLERAYHVVSSAAITATTIQATGVPVLPAVGIVESRASGVTLKPAVGETISQSITVYEADGSTPVDLSGKTLAVVFETRSRVDVAVVPNGDITVNGDDSNIVTFAYPDAVTASERVLRFSLKDASAPGTVYLDGLCVVAYAAGVDDA